MIFKANVFAKQHQFIHSTAATATYCGGIGAGKSIADVLTALYWGYTYPGIDMLLCASTYAMLRDTILREFKIHCPPIFLKRLTEGPYPEAVLDFGRGESMLRFRAFDDAFKPRSLTIGGLIVDEAIGLNELTIDALLDRLRQNGMPNYARFSTNADSRNHYFFKRFVLPALEMQAPVSELEYIHTISFDNTRLPENYVARLQALEKNRPLYYRRMVLGEWGELDEDQIGAFPTVPGFTAKYLVAFLDTSFSDSTVSDRTAISIVGFVQNYAQKQNFWKIEFTGKAWQKSVTNTEVINDMIRFIDQFKPIEVCVESQLGDSTQIFIDRFKQAEKDLKVMKNHWSVKHQTKNKHERIMLHVAGNKDRMSVVQNTAPEYLNPIIGYHKGVDHEDEIDSLAGAIDLWQNSPNLKNFIYAAERLRATGTR